MSSSDEDSTSYIIRYTIDPEMLNTFVTFLEDEEREAESSTRLKIPRAPRRLSVKKTAKGKAAKDPNKPKRPAGPFFIFIEGFRKQFKEDNPNNQSVAAVGKAGGAAWKAMFDDVSGGDNDDDSDKSKSEVNDEDDEEGSEEDEDEE